MDIRRRVAGLSIQDIQELKRRVSAARTAVSNAPLLPRPRGAAVPLSLSQARIWSAERSRAAGQAYCIFGIMRLAGELDVGALRRALERILQRHEVLHTCVVEMQDVVTPVAAPVVAMAGFALTEQDLRELGPAELEQRVTELTAQQAAEKFDLARGPLIRGQLLRATATENLLLMQMHQLVADAAALDVIVRELGTLYAAYCAGSADPLPPLLVQYADYAIWQQQWLRSEVREQQLEFWKQQLDGAPAMLELPCDRPRTVSEDHRPRTVTASCGGHVGLRLDPPLVQELKALSSRHEVTLWTTLFAGFAIVLARLSGQQELVIAIPAAKRHPLEAEGLIGPFGNILALRVSLHGDPTIAELLLQLRNTVSAAHNHEALPFEQVMAALQPPDSPVGNPICQVLFELQSTPPTRIDAAGVAFELQRIDQGIGPFDLVLGLCERGDALVGRFSYATGLFESSTIERWVEHYHTLLSDLASNGASDGQRHVGRLQWLTAAQRAQLTAAEHAAGNLEYVGPRQSPSCRKHRLEFASGLEFASKPGQLRSVITLRPGSEAQPPLFLIHDLTGDVWPLYTLAKQLPDSLTVIGLALPSRECLESIERLAATHVRAIRSVQPNGPYRIAGHSVGGVIAYEVARQLLGAGDPVGFVGLIDTTPTSREAASNTAVTGDMPLLLKFFEYAIPNLPAELLADIGSVQDFDEALLRCQRTGLLPETLTAAQVRRWIGNVRASLQASARYIPPPLAAMCLFFGSDEEQWAQAPTYWRTFLGEHLRVVHVGGSHFGIIKQPRVDILAREIAQVLGLGGHGNWQPA